MKDAILQQSDVDDRNSPDSYLVQSHDVDDDGADQEPEAPDHDGDGDVDNNQGETRLACGGPTSKEESSRRAA